MKTSHYILNIAGIACAILLASCKDKPTIVPPNDLHLEQIDSLGWSWDSQTYGAATDLVDAKLFVKTDTIRLHFFGWNTDEDSVIHVKFPENTDEFGRVVLRYRFTGWNNGPADWDMTTQIMIWDSKNSQWLEFTRCITPYGGSFGKNLLRKQMWGKDAYLDITEFLPLLKGDAKFKIFYCGWDATEKKAHAVQLGFGFYDDVKYGHQTFRQKIYDCTEDLSNPGNNGYRAWAYGCVGTSIEDITRLGVRTIHIPDGTHSAILRICFTGHGQDAYYGKGTFPNRENYTVENCAEFDYNEYTIILDDDTLEQKGLIWEINENGANYEQKGTYQYNRAGWGPGKPCNVQHWRLSGLNGKACDITIDLNLDEYIGTATNPRADYVPCYYVEADIFGYE